jgi:hypothetical protein
MAVGQDLLGRLSVEALASLQAIAESEAAQGSRSAQAFCRRVEAELRTRQERDTLMQCFFGEGDPAPARGDGRATG